MERSVNIIASLTYDLVKETFGMVLVLWHSGQRLEIQCNRITRPRSFSHIGYLSWLSGPGGCYSKGLVHVAIFDGMTTSRIFIVLLDVIFLN